MGTEELEEIENAKAQSRKGEFAGNNGAVGDRTLQLMLEVAQFIQSAVCLGKLIGGK